MAQPHPKVLARRPSTFMMNFSLILTDSQSFEGHAFLGGQPRYTEGGPYRAHNYYVRVHPRRSSSALVLQSTPHCLAP
jgi:hypothetical protein